MADVSNSINRSGQYNAIYTERNRWSTSSPDSQDECCLECCCGVCYGLGHFFCLSNMRKSTRIEILWGWIVLLAIVAGMVSTFAVFGAVKWSVAEKDMRIVDSKYSTVFCDSVTLKSNFYFSGYLYDKKPSLAKKKSPRYVQRHQVYLEDKTFKYWKFYLLPGSVVTTQSCSDETFELIIMKGTRNFKLWKQNKYCDNCSLKDTFIFAQCARSSMVSITITADTADDYFFLAYGVSGDVWATTNFYVNRTMYNTSDAAVSCLNQMECDFSLTTHSSQVVVYDLSSKVDGDATLTSICNPRIWFYMTLYGTAPILIGVVLSIVLYKCCKESSQRLRQTRAPRRPVPSLPGERDPLLGSGAHPGVVTSPPKYEDIAGQEEAPPTYQQATER